MQVYYVIPATMPGSQIPASWVSRASALGATLITGDPTGKVTAFPSVAVVSTRVAPVVFPDTAGQATATAIKTAETAATAAEAAHASALVAARAQLATALSKLPPIQAQAETDIATLTASTDPIAPIVSRIITDSLTLAQAVADMLVVLDLASQE